VAVHAFSLNRPRASFTVASSSTGRTVGELTLLRIRPAGWRPGQDIAGTVLEAAADGSGPNPGTRVVALLDWHGWAERAAVPVSRLAALPDNVSFVQAAALPVAGITALRTLRHGTPLLGVLNDETGFAELERAILDAEVKSIADALAKLEFAFACTWERELVYEHQPPAVRAIADVVDFLEALGIEEGGGSSLR